MAILLVLAYLSTVSVQIWLTVLNVRHQRRHGAELPSEFIGSIEPESLEKSAAYNASREAFGVVRELFSAVVILGFLFGGGLETYDRWVGGLVSGRLLQGMLFFAGLQLAASVLALPFDAYSTFRIEQQHGFNRTTPGLFVADWLKGTLLGLVLLAGVTAAGLSLYYASPTWSWLFFWAFGLAFALLLMLITPYVIEPLFIKTKPLSKDELASAVRELAAKAGVRVTRVLEMDASRRSSHSNAYFTGIGSVKRVVLFDTLLERLSDTEILAVLGHELGHWKLRHITQRLVVTALLGLFILYGAARWLAWDGVGASIGLPLASVPAKLVILAFMAGIASFLLTPLSAGWSRRHERQADAFAIELTGDPQSLASALVKLARDNLTNLFPHPFYSAFYHSHPPTVLRVRRLLARGS